MIFLLFYQLYQGFVLSITLYVIILPTVYGASTHSLWSVYCILSIHVLTFNMPPVSNISSSMLSADYTYAATVFLVSISKTRRDWLSCSYARFNRWRRAYGGPLQVLSFTLATRISSPAATAAVEWLLHGAFWRRRNRWLWWFRTWTTRDSLSQRNITKLHH